MVDDNDTPLHSVPLLLRQQKVHDRKMTDQITGLVTTGPRANCHHVFSIVLLKTPRVHLISTHRGGHTLDVIITRSEFTVGHVDVSIPCPDHSRIVAGLDLLFPQDHTTVLRTTRSWRTLTPSFVICASLRCFVNHRLRLTNCLTAIIRLYRPWLTYMLHRRQFGSVPTAQLAGTMLNVVVQKRQTRKMERRYRKYGTTETRLAWREQFSRQRELFQMKLKDFWAQAIYSIM